MAHTPEWKADECTDANGSITIRWADGSPNGDLGRAPIATVYCAISACLIESAPDLLAACKAMLACPDMNVNELDPYSVTALNTALAAIAAAEGGGE